MLERLIARSTDIVVATDRKGRVIYYNDGASRILGYKIGGDPRPLRRARSIRVSTRRKRVMQAMRSDEYGGRGIVETFQTTFRSKARRGHPGRHLRHAALRRRRATRTARSASPRTCARSCARTSSRRSARWRSGLSHEINNPLGGDREPGRAARARRRRRSPASATSRSSASALDAIRREVGADRRAIVDAARRDGRDRDLRDDRLRRPGAHDRPAREARGGPPTRAWPACACSWSTTTSASARALKEILEAAGCRGGDGARRRRGAALRRVDGRSTSCSPTS